MLIYFILMVILYNHNFYNFYKYKFYIYNIEFPIFKISISSF